MDELDLGPPRHHLKMHVKLDVLPQHLENKITGCYFILCRLKRNWKVFDAEQTGQWYNLQSEPFDDSFVVPFGNLLGAMKVVGDFFTWARVPTEHHERLVQKFGTYVLKVWDQISKMNIFSTFATSSLPMIVELSISCDVWHNEGLVQQIDHMLKEESLEKKWRKSLKSAEIELLFLKIGLFNPVEGEANPVEEEANPVEEVVECDLCFEPLTERSRILTLQCSHFFHAKCLFHWLFTGSGANSCPKCRSRIDS